MVSDPSSGTGEPRLLKQQVLVRRNVDAMVGQAPAGWTRIEAAFISAGRWLQLMYLTIRSSGEVSTTFDYDNRPPRAGSFGPALQDDLDMYPRDSIPQWVLDDIAETRRILAERGELDAYEAAGVTTATSNAVPAGESAPALGTESAVPLRIDEAIVAAAAGFMPENPVTTYRKITRRYGTAEGVVQIFQEIDEDGYENRRVEVFHDGHADFAGVAVEGGTTSLADDPVPPLMEVADRPDVVAEEITPAEFQSAWLAADGYG